MNPLTNMKNVIKLSEQDLQSTSKSSWHDQYKDSAWIFIGGLPYDLTEGDIICVFSQYGEVVNINLIRDKDTGKSKGFCFLCYEDQRSTILAVDNFNGIKILKRTIRVDHVQDYKVPKEGKKTDEETKKIYAEGCAPKATPIVLKQEPLKQDVRETLADQIEGTINLPLRLPIYTNIKSEPISDNEGQKKVKKEKKEKKKKKDKKKKSKKKSKKSESSFDETDSSESEGKKTNVRIKSRKRHSRTSSEESDRGNVDKDNRLNSKEPDRNRSNNRDRKDKYGDSKYDKSSVGSSKYSSSYRSEKHSSSRDYYSSKSDDHKSSSKGSDGAHSRDRNERVGSPKRYKRDMSPNIPKRWK